jgi:hypothetical protein
MTWRGQGVGYVLHGWLLLLLLPLPLLLLLPLPLLLLLLVQQQHDKGHEARGQVEDGVLGCSCGSRDLGPLLLSPAAAGPAGWRTGPAPPRLAAARAADRMQWPALLFVQRGDVDCTAGHCTPRTSLYTSRYEHVTSHSSPPAPPAWRAWKMRCSDSTMRPGSAALPAEAGRGGTPWERACVRRVRQLPSLAPHPHLLDPTPWRTSTSRCCAGCRAQGARRPGQVAHMAGAPPPPLPSMVCVLPEPVAP